MREKSLEGAYDTHSYELMKADLELLVRNAMTFNMPKDEAHYRAKILLVVGTRYLNFFKDLIECT
jgi:predicted nucleotidyltransferase